MHLYGLKTFLTPDARVVELGENHWRLENLGGEAGQYRNAQLDNYRPLRRSRFPHTAPLHLTLKARTSGAGLPGTWGFGLWNDPFGLNMANGGVRLLPALPNAAWFFFASPENHLSFRNDTPGSGPLAQVFRSPHIPTWAFAPGVVFAPLLVLRAFSRLARRLASKIIREDAAQLTVDPAEWHTYRIDWEAERVCFSIDGQAVFTTPLAPRGPLGIVLWIDNQYAHWRPDGALGFGTLPNPPMWLEIKELSLT